jgi:hypothetical protein
MASDQVLEQPVDSEQVFVLQYIGSEQVFGKGDAMSVAFELEYEIFQPRLQLVVDRPERPSRQVQVRRRRLLVAAVAAVLLILLMLPIRALGGSTLAAAGPTQGQEYIVKSGDTLASIALRADRGDAAGMVARLASETGSRVVVPGERIAIP